MLPALRRGKRRFLRIFKKEFRQITEDLGATAVGLLRADQVEGCAQKLAALTQFSAHRALVALEISAHLNPTIKDALQRNNGAVLLERPNELLEFFFEITPLQSLERA